MVSVSRDEVIHLADLSKLRLMPDEIDNLRFDIESILAYVGQLNELDTSRVEPTYQVTDLENVWREDIAMESEVTREDLLALSASHVDNQVKVPKVL